MDGWHHGMTSVSIADPTGGVLELEHKQCTTSRFPNLRAFILLEQQIENQKWLRSVALPRKFFVCLTVNLLRRLQKLLPGFEVRHGGGPQIDSDHLETFYGRCRFGGPPSSTAQPVWQVFSEP